MNVPALQAEGPISPVPTVTGTMDIVRAALATGNVEMYREAVALAKELDAIAARKAFDNAMSDAKADIKPVVRNATGHNSKKYADFAAIARAVDPVISQHGLSYRFRTVQTEKTITVTCILSHRSGHFEESSLCGPADATGNKNAIQAIGSTLTYLQRYSLVQALGLAAGEDDDGRTSDASGIISQDHLEQLIALADEVGADKRALCTYFKIDGLAQMPAKDFDRAIAALNKKRGQK